MQLYSISSEFICVNCVSCSFQPRVIKVLNLWQKNGTFSTEVIQPLHQLAPQGGWSGVWQWGCHVVCLWVLWDMSV